MLGAVGRRTVVVTLAVLFEGFESGWSALTVAVLVMVEAAAAVT